MMMMIVRHVVCTGSGKYKHNGHSNIREEEGNTSDEIVTICWDA